MARLITQSQFSRLRLRDFCGGDDLYSDEADEHGEFVCESIRGIHFARPVSQPDETFIIDIDLLDHSTDAGPAILASIGIPVNRTTTTVQLIEILGTPHETLGRQSDGPPPQSEIFTFKIGGDSGYDIQCSFIEPGAPADWLPCYRVATRSLWQILIARADLRDLFPEEKTGPEYPDAIRIGPTLIGSPECFVDSVYLARQPSSRNCIGVFIDFSLLDGMSNPRAKLLMENSTGEQTTMIWLAVNTTDDGRCMIVNSIDRGFVATSVVEIDIDEQHGRIAQTYLIPLGDFLIR